MFYASLPVLSALVSAIKAAQDGDNSHLSQALALFEQEQKEQKELSEIADSVPSDRDLTIDGSSLVLPNGDGYDVMCWHYLPGKKTNQPTRSTAARIAALISLFRTLSFDVIQRKEVTITPNSTDTCRTKGCMCMTPMSI